MVLIIAVCGLWFTVIYRSLNQYFFSKETVSVPSDTKIAALSRPISKDTFVLQPLARDPFLNRRIITATTVSRPKMRKVTAPTPVKKTVVNSPWPQISYMGSIQSKQRKDALVLVSINNKLHKLSTNETAENITIKKVYRDSIEVWRGKDKKIILINKTK